MKSAVRRPGAEINDVVAAGIIKQYHTSSERALDQVDLHAPEGSVLGLLGPNGAGKSTMIGILATLIRPDAGTATVAGADVRRSPHLVRQRVGLCGQRIALDAQLTVTENLVLVGRLTGMSRRKANMRSAELLDRMRLTGEASRLIKHLSVGTVRKVDVAASLMAAPPVLFLDEPTTGLDPQARIDVWNLVKELVGNGTTVILTTQYLEEADVLASRITVLHRGRVIASGSLDELKAATTPATVAVTVAPEDTWRAAHLLRQAGYCVSDLNPHTGTVGLTMPPGTEGTDTILIGLTLLRRAGLATYAAELRRPTLDEVYLRLTDQAVNGQEDVLEQDNPRLTHNR